jgi:hypothetical protein
MIHLHSMFSSETNTSTAGQNSSAPLSQATLDNFHGALSDAVSSTLEKFGIHPNDVKISVTRASVSATPPAPTRSDPTGDAAAVPATSANAETLPITETASTADTSSSSAAASSSSSTLTGMQQAFGAFEQAESGAPSSSNTTTPAASTASTATETAQEAFDNAYWASQPAPVQALRTMQNQEQRTALATQLASEGYSIDVPIMVWGWDPSVTTAMRQADGYTWVPSALQAPVQDAPGLPSYGTVAAYNANNPPSGSIAV